MINYTERIAVLMHDIVVRTPRLSFIDLREVIVFGRPGRSDAEGAFATCHCLTLPESEPGYYFWRDRTTGELTRRSEWFVTKSTLVRIGGTRVKYSSRSCCRASAINPSNIAQGDLYPPTRPAAGQVDTLVHDLSHRSRASGIRRVSRSTGGTRRARTAALLRRRRRDGHRYLASGADRRSTIPEGRLTALTARHGGVVATTFKNFPSFPQRYWKRLTSPVERFRW